jgi:ubiquinone/menaquinone biosynthesis C-methylase UbiE
MENMIYEFEKVSLTVENFQCEGFTLDIGGGGEGVIGRLKGQNCIAIDLSKTELEEASEGPIKIIMDARELTFLDNSFDAATAFFSMMYVKTSTDQEKIFQEVFRVLKPGSRFYFWDVDLSELPKTEKEYFVINLEYKVNGKEYQTGYGQMWPEEARGEQYYLSLAQQAGFKHLETVRNLNIIYMVFQKR